MRTIELVEKLIESEDFENTVEVTEFYVFAKLHVSAQYLNDTFLKSLMEYGVPYSINMNNVRFTRLN